MRRTATAAAPALIWGAALLLAMPALAQAPMGRDAPRDNSAEEMLRHARQQASTPAATFGGTDPAMPRAARLADSQAGRDAAALVARARQAAEAGNWTTANEMAERAQTALLNLHVQGAVGGTPGQGAEALREVTALREAIARRDRAATRQAVARLEQAGGPVLAQSGAAGADPMQRGRADGSVGSGSLRDGAGAPQMTTPPGGVAPQGGGQRNEFGTGGTGSITGGQGGGISPGVLPPGAPGTSPRLESPSGAGPNQGR